MDGQVMMSVDSLSDDTPERLSHLEEGDVNIVDYIWKKNIWNIVRSTLFYIWGVFDNVFFALIINNYVYMSLIAISDFVCGIIIVCIIWKFGLSIWYMTVVVILCFIA